MNAVADLTKAQLQAQRMGVKPPNKRRRQLLGEEEEGMAPPAWLSRRLAQTTPASVNWVTAGKVGGGGQAGRGRGWLRRGARPWRTGLAAPGPAGAGRRTRCAAAGPETPWLRPAAAQVSPIKDQGDCGSCWAFSAVGALESSALIAIGKTYDLSEQQ